MHLLVCSVFVLLLVEMRVGAQDDVLANNVTERDLPPTLTDYLCVHDCNRSYRSEIIHPSSRYPDCCLNVGNCMPNKCMIERNCTGECTPIYKKIEHWCGPEEPEITQWVVSGCWCKPIIPDPRCEHALVDHYEPTTPGCKSYNVRRCLQIPCGRKNAPNQTCQPQYKRILLKCPETWVSVQRVESCFCC